MDIKNIRLNLLQVVVVIVQTVSIVWFFSVHFNKLAQVADTTSRTEKKVDNMETDNKLWKGKIEADLSELKVRTAILESKVHDMELKNFGR